MSVMLQCKEKGGFFFKFFHKKSSLLLYEHDLIFIAYTNWCFVSVLGYFEFSNVIDVTISTKRENERTVKNVQQ